MRNTDWMASGSCRSVGYQAFFPPEDEEGHASSPTGVYSAARRVCFNCPVQVECLRYILDVERGCSQQSRHGMWAGFTPAERKSIDRGELRPRLAKRVQQREKGKTWE